MRGQPEQVAKNALGCSDAPMSENGFSGLPTAMITYHVVQITYSKAVGGRFSVKSHHVTPWVQEALCVFGCRREG